MIWSVTRRLTVVVAALLLFVLALHLMQEAAREVAPLLRERFDLHGFSNSLGFGWLASYLTVGGSPVAASAVSLLDGRTIQRESALAMVIGSRIGGSLVVLLIAFVYWINDRQRKRSLEIGTLTMMVTATTYLPALVLGWGLLRLGFLADLADRFPMRFDTRIGRMLSPVTRPLSEALPEWGTFLLGLGLIVLSFELFDLAFPGTDDGEPPELLRRVEGKRWWMLALGAAVTLISLSVTVSVGLLVPVAARRMVRVQQVVPYILGANVTTLVDTLLAGLVLGNPDAVAVVLAVVTSVVAVSLVFLLLAFGRYEHSILWLTHRALETRLHLAAFLALLLLVPGTLLLF